MSRKAHQCILLSEIFLGDGEERKTVALSENGYSVLIPTTRPPFDMLIGTYSATAIALSASRIAWVLNFGQPWLKLAALSVSDVVRLGP